MNKYTDKKQHINLMIQKRNRRWYLIALYAKQYGPFTTRNNLMKCVNGVFPEILWSVQIYEF